MEKLSGLILLLGSHLNSRIGFLGSSTFTGRSKRREKEREGQKREIAILNLPSKSQQVNEIPTFGSNRRENVEFLMKSSVRFQIGS